MKIREVSSYVDADGRTWVERPSVTYRVFTIFGFDLKWPIERVVSYESKVQS